jgi:hypothetical protein
VQGRLQYARVRGGTDSPKLVALRKTLSQAILFAAPVAVGSALAFITSSEPSSASPAWLLTALTVLGLASVGPLMVLRRNRPLWSELGVVYAAVWFLTFGVATLPWLGNPSQSAVQLSRADVSLATWALGLGIAAFWLGYLTSRNRSGRVHESPIPSLGFRLPVALTLIGAGILARLYLIGTGAYGYTLQLSPEGQNISHWLILLGDASEFSVYALFAVSKSTGDRKRRNLAILAAGALALLGLAAGGKWIAIRPLVGLGFISVAFRRKLPWRTTLVVLLVFLFLVLPGTQMLRSRSGILPETSLRGVAQLNAVGSSLDVDLRTRLRIVQQWLLSKPRVIDTVALIIRDTPERNPYLFGRLYLLAPVYNLVPRAIWPSKPVLMLEYEFDRQYKHLPPSAITNTALTQPGDLYMNFGLPGLLGGMMTLGLVLGWLTQRWYDTRNPRRMILYVAATLTIVFIETSVTGLLLSAPRTVVVAWLVGILVLPRAGRSTPQGLPPARSQPGSYLSGRQPRWNEGEESRAT